MSPKPAAGVEADRLFRHFGKAGRDLPEGAGGLEAIRDVSKFSWRQADVRGGTGANFVVDWAAAGEIAEPVIEALVVGSVGSGTLCVHQPGRPTRTAGKK